MITSFIAAPINQLADVLALKSCVSGNHTLHSDCQWSFLFKINDATKLSNYKYSDGKKTLYVIGEIINIRELRQLAVLFDSASITDNVASLVNTIYQNLGASAFRFFEGGFNILIEHFDGRLEVYSDPLGLQPINILSQPNVWITSELKSLIPLGDNTFTFQTPAEVSSNHWRADNYSPISNLRRVKPGEVVIIKNDGQEYPYIESNIYTQFGLNAPQEITKEEAFTYIDSFLAGAVRNSIEDSNIIIPLSGGLDSSLVASLASQYGKSLRTVSIGTEENNEFQFSRIVSNHINSKHEELLLSEEDILDGVVNSIYLNEIFDGLSAEIQSSLFFLYKQYANTDHVMVTGYGSDLLFGGVLSPNYPDSDVNLDLWKQVYRTRWTNEFSPFGAMHYGLNVRHPFWTNKLISFCLSLSPKLKISPVEIKTVLRDYAAHKNILPTDIVWRKKIGIHEGSSVNAIFARMIGTSKQDYKRKTEFTYQIYKQFFKDGLRPHEVDLKSLASSIQN